MTGPVTPFVPRWWDERERWESLGIGLVYKSQKIYFGNLPDRPLGPVIGTPDMWLNGLSYERWLNGEYANPQNWCANVTLAQPIRMHQKQGFFTTWNIRWYLREVQSLRTVGGVVYPLRQIQNLRAYPLLGWLHQRQGITALPYVRRSSSRSSP